MRMEGGGGCERSGGRSGREWLKMFRLGLEERASLGTRPAAMSKLGNSSPIVTVSGTGAT